MVEPGRRCAAIVDEGGANLSRGARACSPRRLAAPATAGERRHQRGSRSACNLAVTPGVGGPAHRGLRAHPVQAARRTGADRCRCCSSRRRSTATTSSTSRRAQHGRVPGARGAAGLRRSPGATPSAAAGPLRSRHLRAARASRRATPWPRSRSSRPCTSTPPARAGSSPPPPSGTSRQAASSRRREPDAVRLRARQTRASGAVGARDQREAAAAAVAESARRATSTARPWRGCSPGCAPTTWSGTTWSTTTCLARTPPAFDILYWNQDAVRLAAGLHRDFVLLALENSMAHPRRRRDLGTPIDLGAVDVSTPMSVAGLKDHIVPWETPTAATQLLGGDGASCSPPAATSRRWSTRPSPDRVQLPVTDEPRRTQDFARTGGR